ncbi:MAG: M23 family metallopeptidase [Oscillospiraceae bacterium]
MDRRRDYRFRSRNRRIDEEVDAVAVALTVQIIICIILLIAAGTAKKINQEKYGQFKQEFIHLVNDTSGEQLAAYFQELGDISQSFFTSVENFLRRVLWGGDSPEQTPAPPPSPDQESFGYSYLAPQEISTRQVPFAMGGNLTQQMEAPDGNTLAPVYLAGSARPPIAGEVTSPFAYRLHPVDGKVDFHNGIDVAAPEGRGILAALPGEVVEVGYSSVYGNYIVLQHATNLKTFYAHCSQIIAKEGMAVRQGERIALVGKTGLATGPHLHFSVIVEEQFADPYWILSDYLELVE